MRPTYHIRDFVGYTNQHRHLTCWRAEHYILHHAIDNTANQSTGKSLYTRQYYTLTRRTLHWLCWPLIFYNMVWNRYTLGEKSLREYWGILWKSFSLQQNLAPATSCTNSNWFVFLRLVARRKWLKLVLSQRFAASEYFCKTSLQQTRNQLQPMKEQHSVSHDPFKTLSSWQVNIRRQIGAVWGFFFQLSICMERDHEDI